MKGKLILKDNFTEASEQYKHVLPIPESVQCDSGGIPVGGNNNVLLGLYLPPGTLELPCQLVQDCSC